MIIVDILLPSFLSVESIITSNNCNICNHAVVVASDVNDVPLITMGILSIGLVAVVVVTINETCFDSPLLNDTELEENSNCMLAISSILVLS